MSLSSALGAPDASPPPDRLAVLGDLFARSVAPLERTLELAFAELALIDGAAGVRVFGLHPGVRKPETLTAARGDFSELAWTTDPRLVADLAQGLDSAFAADRRWIESGARALLVLPLRASGLSFGVLVLGSRDPTVFDATPARCLEPMAEFLAIAADRERSWAAEHARHLQRVKLDAALPTIARSLDVRKVFAELSGPIGAVIPHDVLAFALLLPDRSGVRVQASTERGVLELPEYRFSNPEEALDAKWQFLLAHDLAAVDTESVRARISPRGAPETIEVVVQPGAAWMKFIVEARIRSTLRVPIRSKDRPIGGVVFMSRSPDAYDEEDGLVASRIADQLALALAHQELADEERRIALAEERARSLERRVEQLSNELERFSAHRAIGRSPAWKRALADASQVAATDATVLITGESGTGKEVVARWIHRASRRAKGPFLALNCAALPEQLLESELFGHERGAFTGASEARPGKIEQAAGGVLFLDEVGEMSPTVQAKFLRVLQEREFQRVGGSKVHAADVRIVAATNRDPRAGIAAGTFREDLYYRLNVFEIHLPPLRERSEDVLVLAEAFREEIGRSIGRPAAGLSESARERLLAHSWPGNVRELRNAIERATILCQGGLIASEHLPLSVMRGQANHGAAAAPPPSEFPVEGVKLDAVERDLLEKALAKTGNNKTQAARLLGLTRGQIYSLMRRHGLTRARR